MEYDFSVMNGLFLILPYIFSKTLHEFILALWDPAPPTAKRLQGYKSIRGYNTFYPSRMNKAVYLNMFNARHSVFKDQSCFGIKNFTSSDKITIY